MLPANSAIGSYQLNFNGFDYYMGIYNPTDAQSLVATSGSLIVLANDTVASRIRGNFQFLGTDILGSDSTIQISNGYFSVYYGQ
jgi:hypothetical protein